jgi:2,3-bisphosphoglycerate-dependent phosphoglycerate mutase
MEFYFIRHGQSSNNLLFDTTGSSMGRCEDPELTEIGREQAQIVARFLRAGNPALIRKLSSPPGFGITHLYTSLMVRAVATATTIAHELGLPLKVWEDLHETGGIYLDDEITDTRVGQPGKNRAYFEKYYPDLQLPDTLGAEGWWNRPFEERAERPARAERLLRELLARHGDTDDRVAVISHGGLYNYLLRAIFKAGCEHCWFSLHNVAITRLDFDADGINLVYMNRVDFIPPDLVT